MKLLFLLAISLTAAVVTGKSCQSFGQRCSSSCDCCDPFALCKEDGPNGRICMRKNGFVPEQNAFCLEKNEECGLNNTCEAPSLYKGFQVPFHEICTSTCNCENPFALCEYQGLFSRNLCMPKEGTPKEQKEFCLKRNRDCGYKHNCDDPYFTIHGVHDCRRFGHRCSSSCDCCDPFAMCEDHGFFKGKICVRKNGFVPEQNAFCLKRNEECGLNNTCEAPSLYRGYGIRFYFSCSSTCDCKNPFALCEYQGFYSGNLCMPKEGTREDQKEFCLKRNRDCGYKHNCDDPYFTMYGIHE